MAEMVDQGVVSKTYDFLASTVSQNTKIHVQFTIESSSGSK